MNCMSIKDRIFIFRGSKNRSDRLQIIVLAPIFIFIGVTLRYLILRSFENSDFLNYFLNTVFPIGVLYFGFFLFDLLD